MSNMKPGEPGEVSCSAGCKRVGQMGEGGAPPPGWEQLPITGRWRCPHCYRELEAARSIEGTPSRSDPDPLPPGSIGSLKKLPVPPPLHEGVKP